MPVQKKAFKCGVCFEWKAEEDLSDPDGMWEEDGILMGSCDHCGDAENGVCSCAICLAQQVASDPIEQMLRDRRLA